LIWKDDKAKKFGFGPHNTVIIDSEAFKVRDWPRNSIVVKPYTLNDVLTNSCDSLPILTQCRDYLTGLLNDVENV